MRARGLARVLRALLLDAVRTFSRALRRLSRKPQDSRLVLSTELARSLGRFHLENLWLGFSQQDLDFCVVSFSQQTPPLVGVFQSHIPARHLVLRLSSVPALLGGRARREPLRGRIVRMFPPPVGAAIPEPVSDLFPQLEITAQEWELKAVPRTQKRETLDSSELSLVALTKAPHWHGVPAPEAPPSPCPLILVWLVFLSVGGVERNTLEIMRQLKGHYRFLVVTIEPPAGTETTLHRQLEGSAVGVYDLFELAPQHRFLELLGELKQRYQPSLVWICNADPWQMENAGRIRELFADVPIVDQAVYDARIGWIKYYDREEIQSYDHFISVNEKIRERFQSGLGIHADRISLIYSAVKTDRFNADAVSHAQQEETRNQYDLTRDQRVIVWMARLHPQKRPMLFLDAVAQIASRHPETRFLMFGDGQLSSEVETALQTSDLPVTWKRFVEDTTSVWSIADGLFITSEYEALPITMIEAMCMGVPVLTTDVGDNAVFINRYRGGSVYPVTANAQATAAAFDIWLDSWGEHKQAAVSSAAAVRDFFDSRTISHQYDTCWRSLIGTRHRCVE